MTDSCYCQLHVLGFVPAAFAAIKKLFLKTEKALYAESSSMEKSSRFSRRCSDSELAPHSDLIVPDSHRIPASAVSLKDERAPAPPPRANSTVGWNCTNSTSVTVAPACNASAMPSAVAPGGLVLQA